MPGCGTDNDENEKRLEFERSFMQSPCRFRDEPCLCFVEHWRTCACSQYIVILSAGNFIKAAATSSG